MRFISKLMNVQSSGNATTWWCTTQSDKPIILSMIVQASIKFQSIFWYCGEKYPYPYMLTAKLPLCLVWTAISHAWCWFLSDRVLRYLRIVSSCWWVRIPWNPIRYPSSTHEIPMKSQWNHHSMPFDPLKFPVDPTWVCLKIGYIPNEIAI